ncbi:ATP-binding protein [Streptosporangium sp. CA-115845]|uniref:ATP-binding protein n=1 Tax=Streptosporangium sp. CA-115845 TaxID=3240071 RepID=UPI003D8CA3FF
MNGREPQPRQSGRHRRGTVTEQVAPQPWDPAERAAAEQLDQIEPAWTVWYGPGTRHFHAVAVWPTPEPLTLRARTADEFQVQVTDRGTGQPRHLTLDPESLHGRGLTIVRALAHDTGVTPLPDRPGKTVWARWRLPRQTTATQASS